MKKQPSEQKIEVLDFKHAPLSQNMVKMKKMPKKKKFNEYEQGSSLQLSLFELLEESVSGAGKYSQSIALYDFMPKYVWGKAQEVLRRDNNGFLPTLERVFQYNGTNYRLRIHSASIRQNSGKDKLYYPGESEEILEDVLRKMATEGKALLLDRQVGVTFSLYELRKELKKVGRQRSLQQIKQSLKILALTTLELTNLDRKEDEDIFSPFSHIGFRGEKESGEETTYVIFSPLVTKSIEALKFRLFDYERLMSYKNIIARHLFKRLSHHYSQASISNSYSILLTTIVRDFGLTSKKPLWGHLQDAEESLNLLKENDVILLYKIDKIVNPKKKNKIDDYMLELVPTPQFVRTIKKANFFDRKKTEEVLKSERNKD